MIPSRTPKVPTPLGMRPSFLRRGVGTTALYIVGIPMIVLGMLLVFSIVAYDTIDKRFRKASRQG
jgi:hypothetical protein